MCRKEGHYERVFWKENFWRYCNRKDSFYSKNQNVVVRKKTEDSEGEIARYEAAREKAIEQLHGLYEKALKEVGEMNAEIFEVHAMMLEDDDYNDSVKNIITSQKVNAEYAVGVTGDNFSEMFANMEDDYFQGSFCRCKGYFGESYLDSLWKDK